MGTALVRYNNNKPNQPVIGPGKTGKKDPAIPKRVRRKPTMIRIISIYIFLKVKEKRLTKYTVFHPFRGTVYLISIKASDFTGIPSVVIP